jgi:hypothetical protein
MESDIRLRVEFNRAKLELKKRVTEKEWNKFRFRLLKNLLESLNADDFFKDTGSLTGEGKYGRKD